MKISLTQWGTCATCGKPVTEEGRNSIYGHLDRGCGRQQLS